MRTTNLRACVSKRSTVWLVTNVKEGKQNSTPSHTLTRSNEACTKLQSANERCCFGGNMQRQYSVAASNFNCVKLSTHVRLYNICMRTANSITASAVDFERSPAGAANKCRTLARRRKETIRLWRESHRSCQRMSRTRVLEEVSSKGVEQRLACGF